jgi:uncharacterized protein involved in tellurium resistance
MNFRQLLDEKIKIKKEEQLRDLKIELNSIKKEIEAKFLDLKNCVSSTDLDLDTLENLQDFYKSMRETYIRHYNDSDLDIRSKLKSDITILKYCLDDMSKFLTKNNYQDQRLSIPTCGDDDE